MCKRGGIGRDKKLGCDDAVFFAVGLALVWSVSIEVDAKDFVVGQSLDLSGVSNLGKGFSNGVHTYFDAINARGGLRGRKARFMQLDDSGRADNARANVET